MVGCKVLHMSHSVAGRASQRTAMLAFCLEVQHSISNSVKIWCPPMGRITSWVGNWLAIPSDSAPFLFLHFFYIEQFWVKYFEGGLVSPSLHWGPFLTTGHELLRVHLPTVGHLS